MWTASVEQDAAHLPPLEDPPGLHRAFVSRSRSVLDDHVGGAHAEVHEEVAHERGDGRDRRPGVESSPVTITGHGFPWR